MKHPGMLVHKLQITLNFLYVCQSVSWLTSLLKLDKYRHISSSGWDIFLNCFGDIPGMLVHYIQIILNILYVRQSVGWLTSLLELYKYRDTSSSGWEIFLKFLWIHSWDVGTLFPNNPEFNVCLSVCLFAYFLTKIRQRYISWSGLEIFSEFFWKHSGGIGTLDPNNSEFFVCLSVW